MFDDIIKSSEITFVEMYEKWIIDYKAMGDNLEGIENDEYKQYFLDLKYTKSLEYIVIDFIIDKDGIIFGQV